MREKTEKLCEDVPLQSYKKFVMVIDKSDIIALKGQENFRNGVFRSFALNCLRWWGENFIN